MCRLRKHLYACTFILVSMILIPGLISAQSRSKIIGKVTDEATGNPLAGANIYLVGTAIGAATDMKGEYIIYSVPPGRFPS